MTDLLKDIDNFHKKYGFEKNEKVGGRMQTGAIQNARDELRRMVHN